MATKYPSKHTMYFILWLHHLQHCYAQTECNANEPCHILCDNHNDNCHQHGYTVQCPSDYPCLIDCSGSASCYQAKIECGSSTKCTITVNGTIHNTYILYPFHSMFELHHMNDPSFALKNIVNSFVLNTRYCYFILCC